MRVAETAPPEVAAAAGFRKDESHPEISAIGQLAEYDGIVIGAPTRFGRMPSQMASFLDQAGGLWYTDALVGKVGAAFTSTAAQHGGQETTLQGAERRRRGPRRFALRGDDDRQQRRLADAE
jgi:NAD(P)H dehydrogenase (quinone)